MLNQVGVVRNAYGKEIPFTEIYDYHVVNFDIPDVSKDDSLGKECVRAYREELESRAAEGDKYAKSALDSINAGRGVEGYDDAGS